MLRPVLVASIGNPLPAYANTLHSAGHTILTALHEMLSYPPLLRSRAHGSGFTSHGPEFTLWQSPSLMNISGRTVKAAWQAFLKNLATDPERRAARLVILHDELESPLGRIKFKQEGSVRGHNGLKSIRESLGSQPFMRVAIGIGRCESREPNEVARYVMRRMRPAELQLLYSKAGEVLALLNEIRDDN